MSQKVYRDEQSFTCQNRDSPKKYVNEKRERTRKKSMGPRKGKQCPVNKLQIKCHVTIQMQNDSLFYNFKVGIFWISNDFFISVEMFYLGQFLRMKFVYLMCLSYVWRNLFLLLLLLLVASSFFLSTLLFLIERCGSVCLFVFFSCSFVSAFQWVILCNHCIPWLSQRFWDLDEEFFVVVFFSSLILWIFF